MYKFDPKRVSGSEKFLLMAKKDLEKIRGVRWVSSTPFGILFQVPVQL